MITDCKLYSQTYVLGEKNSIYKGLPTNTPCMCVLLTYSTKYRCAFVFIILVNI